MTGFLPMLLWEFERVHAQTGEIIKVIFDFPFQIFCLVFCCLCLFCRMDGRPEVSRLRL